METVLCGMPKCNSSAVEYGVCKFHQQYSFTFDDTNFQNDLKKYRECASQFISEIVCLIKKDDSLLTCKLDNFGENSTPTSTFIHMHEQLQRMQSTYDLTLAVNATTKILHSLLRFVGGIACDCDICKLKHNRTKNNCVIFCFDVETRGFSPLRHGLMAVGLVIGTTEGDVLLKKEWKILPLYKEQTYEKRCLDEFWNNNIELKNYLETDAIEPHIFAKEFRELLNMWETSGSVYLLSDNPNFDAKFIDHYLDVYSLLPIQYHHDGRTYRPVHDSESYCRGLVKSVDFKNQWCDDRQGCESLGLNLPIFVGSKHLPADDAEHIFKIHCMFLNH